MLLQGAMVPHRLLRLRKVGEELPAMGGLQWPYYGSISVL